MTQWLDVLVCLFSLYDLVVERAHQRVFKDVPRQVAIVAREIREVECPVLPFEFQDLQAVFFHFPIDHPSGEDKCVVKRADIKV